MSTATSLELISASKFIGRECASINKTYIECKAAKGLDPRECIHLANDVTGCTESMYIILKI